MSSANMNWCQACCEPPPNEARRTGAGGPVLAGLQVCRRYLTAMLFISLKCEQEKNSSRKLFKYEEMRSNQNIIQLMIQEGF